jgi:hypothetical protein
MAYLPGLFLQALGALGVKPRVILKYGNGAN